MEMFSLKGAFTKDQKIRYAELYEMLNQTNSPNVVRLGIRRYELANNLDSFFKSGLL